MPPKKAGVRVQINPGPLTKLGTTKKNTRPRLQSSSNNKRPRSQSLFPDDDSESGDCDAPSAMQRSLNAAGASKKQRKGSGSNAKKTSASVFASIAQKAADGSSVKRKAVASVFDTGMQKRESLHSSEDSDVQSSGRGERGKESVLEAEESTGRRSSKRIRDNKNIKFRLAPSLEKKKSIRQTGNKAASLTSDAKDSRKSADSDRSPVCDDEVKSQSQSGSQQLQLTVKAIARPKSKSKSKVALTKKEQAYERVKQERLSEVEMAFIREEFCVHYPPPPSNMAAAGRYELANRREMTKEMRDALWENELKPWSDKWWVLYGKFTDLARAQKMKKPLTSSTDVRRGECKKWAKAFRKKHGDARPQSSLDKDVSGEAISKLTGTVGLGENADAGSGSSPDGKGGMSEERECSDASDVVEAEGSLPTADQYSCANVASQSAESDIGLSADNDSRNGFHFESQSDGGIVGIAPIRDDDHAVDGKSKEDIEPVPAPAGVARTSSGSGIGPCEVDRRSFAPSHTSPYERQSRAPVGACSSFEQELTAEDHQAFHSPTCEDTQCAAFEPATEMAKEDEGIDFTEPMAGGRGGLKSNAPKVGTSLVGSERIPRKKKAACPLPLAVPAVGQPVDYRVQHDGSGAIGTTPIATRAADASWDPSQGRALENPRPHPDVPRLSTTVVPVVGVPSIPCGQPPSLPPVPSSIMRSSTEGGQFAPRGYDPEQPLLSQQDPAGRAAEL